MSREVGALHPWLRERVESIMQLYMVVAVEEQGSLLVTDTTRTTAEQVTLHSRKLSALDGVKRWSLHQYEPGLGCDLVPMVGPRPSWGEGTEPERARWALLGRLAEERGLSWGGRWTKPHDAPHVEVPERQRVRLLQEALEARGESPGPLDGVFGSRTLAALHALEKRAGLTLTRRATWWAVRPASWAAAHSEELGPTV